MNWPSSKVVGALLGGSAVPVLAILAAFEVIHWDNLETASVVTLWAASATLLAFIYEHLRPGSPSRWVAVLNLVGPEAVSILGVLFVFKVITDTQQGAIYGLVAFVLGVLGVTISQSLVTSPETVKAEVNAAQAVALRAPVAGDVAPPVG